jgi:hypothetical protein
MKAMRPITIYHRANSVALADLLRRATQYRQRQGEAALRELLREFAGCDVSARVPPERRADVIAAIEARL